jgi:hypothetical protein
MIRAKWYIWIAAACAGGCIHIGDDSRGSSDGLCVVCDVVIGIGSKAELGKHLLHVSNMRMRVSPASMYAAMSPSLRVAAKETHLAAM